MVISLLGNPDVWSALMVSAVVWFVWKELGVGRWVAYQILKVFE